MDILVFQLKITVNSRYRDGRSIYFLRRYSCKQCIPNVLSKLTLMGGFISSWLCFSIIYWWDQI